MRIFLPLVLVLGLSACATGGDPQAAMRLACDGYTSALRTATVANDTGQITAAQAAVVDDVVATVGPACEAPQRPETTRDVIDLVQAGTLRLTQILTTPN